MNLFLFTLCLSALFLGCNFGNNVEGSSDITKSINATFSPGWWKYTTSANGVSASHYIEYDESRNILRAGNERQEYDSGFMTSHDMYEKLAWNYLNGSESTYSSFTKSDEPSWNSSVQPVVSSVTHTETDTSISITWAELTSGEYTDIQISCNDMNRSVGKGNGVAVLDYLTADTVYHIVITVMNGQQTVQQISLDVTTAPASSPVIADNILILGMWKNPNYSLIDRLEFLSDGYGYYYSPGDYSSRFSWSLDDSGRLSFYGNLQGTAYVSISLDSIIISGWWDTCNGTWDRITE